MNPNTKKELDTYWRRAKHYADNHDHVALWDLFEEASGLLDYESCGDDVLVKPSAPFGNKHKPIVLNGQMAELFIIEAMVADGHFE
jgi:hypothetical protein